MNQTFLKTVFLLLLPLVGVFPANAQDTFKGIVPFVTTRLEVEKILGRPDGNGRYEFDDGRASIPYVKSECKKLETSCLCLAPVDTVLMVEFQPYWDTRVEDLKLDPKVWKRSPVTGGHVPGLEVYVNEKSGISYEVDTKDGVVTEITYRESEATCNALSKRDEVPGRMLVLPIMAKHNNHNRCITCRSELYDLCSSC